MCALSFGSTKARLAMAYTDLHHVIAQRQDTLLGELLDAGNVSLEARQNGFTALMMAVGAHELMEDRLPRVSKGGNRAVANMLRRLLDAGADIHAAAEGWPLTGLTALHICCMRFPGNVATLIDAGADVNARSTDGLTPLMCAAPHAFVLQRLLRVGADATAVDAQGRNALFHAVTPSAARLLLAAGAAAEQRDVTGKTAADHLQALGHVEAAALVAASRERPGNARPQVRT